MTKGIIVYDSWTGNTKKIAEAIASESRFEIAKVTEAPPDLRNYDILVLGTPNMHAAPSKAISEFIDKAMLPARFALFVTFGAPVWGQISSLICLNKMRNLLSKKGARCKGGFMCPGYHAKHKSYKGKPGEEEISKARKFATKLSSGN
ncbi:MAG: flavodoxin family protein [Deltaproteobacteria bacterium]